MESCVEKNVFAQEEKIFCAPEKEKKTILQSSGVRDGTRLFSFEATFWKSCLHL